MNTSTKTQLGLMFLTVMVAFAMLATTAAPALAQNEGGDTPAEESAPETTEAPAPETTDAPETTAPPPENVPEGGTTSTPNQIRNRVFLDIDGDGILDNGERTLAGVTVTLQRNGSNVATTTTDAAGQYLFRARDGVERGVNYTVRANFATNASSLPGGVSNGQLSAAAVGVLAGRVNNTGAILPFDLELQVSVDTSTINRSNRTVRFNLTVVNQGQRVESFQVIDYFDQLGAGQWADFSPGLNPNGSASGRSWAWNNRDPRRPVVTVSGGLATGQSVIIPIVMRWSEPLPSSISALQNAAEIINFDDGSRTAGDAASGAIRDRDSNPDRRTGNDRGEDDHDAAGFGLHDLALTTTLNGGSDIVPGSRVTFTITVQNQGLVNADDIVIVDYLPTSGLRLSDSDWTRRTDGTADITIPGRLAPGARTSVSIDFISTADATGSISNFAEIASASPVNSEGQRLRSIRDVDSTPDRNGSNDGSGEDDRDGASVRIGHFDLALTSTVAGTDGDTGVASIGNAVVFNHVIVNEGTVPASDVVLVNYVPRSGLTLVDPDWQDNGNGTATLRSPVRGPIAAGATVVVPITFVVDADAEGTIYNWAEIAGFDTDSDSSTPTPVDIDSEPADNPRYDSVAGSLVDFEAIQEAAAPDTTISPEDIDPDSFDPDAEPAPPVERTTTNVRRTLPREAAEDDHDFAGITIEPPEFDLAIDVQVDDKVEIESLQIGDEVIFTITVSNQGTTFADEVTIVDFLPATGIVLDSQSWDDLGNGTATTELTGSIAPGTTVATDIRFEVGEGALGTIENSVGIVSAIASDSMGNEIRNSDGTSLEDIDSLPGGELPGTVGDEDDTATVRLAFATPPDFNLALFADLAEGSQRSVFQPGDSVTYAVSVFNNGIVNASDIELVLEVPDGFTIASRDWNPSRNSATRTLKGILVPGETAEFEIEFRADEDARGNFDNTLQIVGARSVDDVGSIITATNGQPLRDIDSTDDSTVLELSVVPTLAFNGGGQSNILGMIGWGLLSAAAFVALIGVSLRRKETVGARPALPSPANSRFGPA